MDRVREIVSGGDGPLQLKEEIKHLNKAERTMMPASQDYCVPGPMGCQSSRGI